MAILVSAAYYRGYRDRMAGYESDFLGATKYFGDAREYMRGYREASQKIGAQLFLESLTAPNVIN